MQSVLVPSVSVAIGKHKAIRIGKRLRVKAMRAVVQRVASASVEVDGRVVSQIGPGLLVLVGIHHSDSDSDADYICRKVLNMRLFPNENTGKTWDHSVINKGYQVLLVSQFTLYGFLKGNKPDFHVAMPPEQAKTFYASLVERFRNAYNPDAIKDGVFGAMMKKSSQFMMFGAMMKLMPLLLQYLNTIYVKNPHTCDVWQVNLVNDGPVTMQLDSQSPKNSVDAAES